MKTRVRLAPSPTGFMHIGNAQSALYNWLFARKKNGAFLLRIEDTDKERSTKEFEQNILDSLKWLSIEPDEPPVIQSRNLLRHTEVLEKLLSGGQAFYCYHTKEELEAERNDQEANKQAPRHVCEYKSQPTGQRVDANPPVAGQVQDGVIRLRVNENSNRVISFEDQIRGKIEFKESLLGDFAIARQVDDPLYHFAVVVDDMDMNISHIIRGEDHISNTPKQILIYEAIQKIQTKPSAIPVFAHLPLILASDRSKLSKRHGGTSIIEYQKDYLPETMTNFLGSLSYTFSKEIISKEEMAKEFELEKVHKSGAVFDIKKLNWINSRYLKNVGINKLRNLTGIDGIPEEALSLITERLEKLSDIQNFSFFWKEPAYKPELLKWRKASLEESLGALEKVKVVIEKNEWDTQLIRSNLDKLGEELGDRGLVYWPFRVALTGLEKSPDPVDVASILTKNKVLDRISKAFLTDGN